ncbi:MAG TPA: thiolase family protein [Candidatus Brachybacterium intestinipullorum]|uniref:Thiolase family protein n=1 Tax=Candidatus Brachybacterium intestinipullorum TaxID=2838512 RepID=A0A9D2PYZ6_9MICO|nr:thiolase family protein [Candidatus Brachybacterium intestinipullorum]
MRDRAVVVAARRTPLGTRSRALAGHGLEQLAAPVLRAVVDDAAAALGAEPPLADVLLGNCMGPGGNPARIAALAAGLGVDVPGQTVDRQCGSGLAAVLDAARALEAGGEHARLASGVESASTAPERRRDGTSYERAPFTPAGWPDPDMPRAAEALAAADGIPRARQDAHAERSHRRARAARRAGRFDAELVPLGEVTDDDSLRASAPPFTRLPPLFPGGTLTAGTSTRISDGAAAVLLVPERARGRAPGLAIRAHAVVGCDPALPGIGAAPAVDASLASAGLGLEDLAAIEIVEAFAAQSLAVLDRLGLPEDDPRICADGGALALGHPWGASGAVAVVRLFSRLVRADAPAGTLGLAAASIGGGMGIAAVVEVVR